MVLEHLLKCGSDDALRSMRAHTYEIQALTRFQYIDEQQKDVGAAGTLYFFASFLKRHPLKDAFCLSEDKSKGSTGTFA